MIDEDHHDPMPPSQDGPLKLAIYPLSIPLLITPPAIAALTALGVEAAVSGERLAVTIAALLAVMMVNIAAFLILARTEHHVPSPVWSIAGRILGVFLVAFGVTIIIDGLRLAF